MTRRTWIILAGLVGAAVIAFALQDVIERTIIRPFAYVWWIVSLYYDAFPQAVLWILIIAFTALIFMGSLSPEQRRGIRKQDPPIIVQGQVESLAIWLTKAPRGAYFKWLVAQRLGKLARDLLAFRSRRNPVSAREALRGADWNPPAEILAYLESGLSGSFADFARARWPFQPPRPTPLDLNPQEALEFIESNLEKS